nr:MAG TPA_asm: hypothetical protein [Caudoviricetes sp.]
MYTLIFTFGTTGMLLKIGRILSKSSSVTSRAILA